MRTDQVNDSNLKQVHSCTPVPLGNQRQYKNTNTAQALSRERFENMINRTIKRGIEPYNTRIVRTVN